jgi:hypothetical protein
VTRHIQSRVPKRRPFPLDHRLRDWRQTARRKAATVAARYKAASDVAGYAHTLAEGATEIGDRQGQPVGYVLVALYEESAPMLASSGIIDWVDLLDVMDAVSEWGLPDPRPIGAVFCNSYSVRDVEDERPDINARVEQRWVRLREVSQRSRDDAEAWDANNPWVCEHCDRRFRSERGAEQHEQRHCPKRPSQAPTML